MALKVQYEAGGPFHEELKRRVDEYFARSGLPRRGGWAIYVKTAIILCWLAASWALLVFVAATWWQAVAAAISLGLAAAGVGFNIQHDANHGGYSDRKRANRVLAWTLDLLGGSSYLWSWKHNVLHHTYTNIAGLDVDIHAEPLLRMSPVQPRRRAHRFQHLYVWLLYALLPAKWQLFDDFATLASGEMAGQKFPRPRGWSLLGVLAGKAVFLSWAFVIPALFHPLWQVLALYGVASVTLGIALSSVFQVAHCVGEADFPHTRGERHRMEHEWAVHQIRTTVDFARGNRLLTWFLGGLNFQVEHHLFPKVCHVHYPALSRIVEATCRSFGLRFLEHRGAVAAVASHVRWLRRMGRPLELGAAVLDG